MPLKSDRRPGRHTTSGQSLTELALIVPILLTLVVLVADFGRVFAASLSMEAATRNAAEAMTNAYLAGPPGPLDRPAPAGVESYYRPLHTLAVRTICNEMSDLANTAFDAATSTCAGMPLIRACIHDGQDTLCASEAEGAAIPAQCNDLNAPMTNANGAAGSPRWAEVRVCYRFSPILADMPFLSFATIWLERERSFTIPCYFALGTSECG